MAFKFEKPKKRAKESSDKLNAYREREKADMERFKLATDGDIGICFCFHDAAERKAFADLVGADENGYCYGDELHELMIEKVGLKSVRSFKAKPLTVGVFPDPFEGLEVTDSLEADCFAEADALLRAFEAVEKKDRYDIVWDSAYYVTAIFMSGRHKAQFIADFALSKFGETFMDGPAVLRYMGEKI